MASRIALAQPFYRFKRPSLIESEGAHLPESYKKFFREWKLTSPAAVHYIPPQTNWIRNEETGEVKRQEDVPIPVLYPPDSHLGIWGGEGVIKGFQKRQKTVQRVPHFWVPNLIQSAVYSEILNKRLEVTVTNRTIDLILEHHGFDNYILKTKACDLQSTLALKMKRKMLMALLNKDLYPDNKIKAEEVYNKYKHFLSEYSKEDIEWYGWTFDEALQKYEKDSEVEPVPLKFKLRKELIQQLANPKQEPEESEPTEKSWLRRINPFGKKTK